MLLGQNEENVLLDSIGKVGGRSVEALALESETRVINDLVRVPPVRIMVASMQSVPLYFRSTVILYVSSPRSP